jgi:hypothetical protein
MKGKRVKSEQKMREELSSYAKMIGAEKDLELLFHKWDTTIAMAPDHERVDMARMAILEVQALLGIYADNGLTIGDQVVIAPSTEKHDQIVVPVSVKEKR